MLQVLVTLLIVLLLVVPTAHYLYGIFGPANPSAHGPVETLLYKAIGLEKPSAPAPMTWREYGAAFLVSNLVMLILAFLILLVQQGFRWDLALHTAISFVTNTNLQHYTPETQLTYLGQMVVITFLMFTAAASGCSVAFAVLRSLTGNSPGNFWADMVRVITKVLLPLSFVVALVLVWQGVPQTFAGPAQATGLEGALQTIYRGPVASLEAIKQLGTNGGGFFSPNAAHPFENPTPLTNLILLVSLMWLPTTFVYLFGLFARSRRLGWIFFSATGALFLGSLCLMLWAQGMGNPILHGLGLPGPSLEGQEVRFGPWQSALFAVATTATSTGAVTAMHEALTPMGTFVTLLNMMLNSIFGGAGVGVMNLLAMAMLTVFLVGLMVGRTPEFLGKKLEVRQISLLALVILLHPTIILLPTALALLTRAGTGALTHEGFRGLTQALYEYTSAAANNGSAFAGLRSNTPFWNLTTGLVMLLGRYPAMLMLLAASGQLLAKPKAPVGPGTLRIETPLFGGILVGIIIVVGALTFFPVLALGPVAEHLSLFRR